VKRTLILSILALATALALAACKTEAEKAAAKPVDQEAAPLTASTPAQPAVQAPAGMPAGMPAAMPEGHPAPQAAAVDVTGVAKAAGGKTVGEIFAATADLAGKEVVFRGKVVKFNSGIMGKNWLHVQDGSGEAGTNDLTVTTDGTAAVGDTVLVKGVLGTDKDFGFGYKYAVIVENAAVTVE